MRLTRSMKHMLARLHEEGGERMYHGRGQQQTLEGLFRRGLVWREDRSAWKNDGPWFVLQPKYHLLFHGWDLAKRFFEEGK